MTARTPAQRKADQRERDKLREEERLARLLARRITLDIYKGTDYALIRSMVRAGIDEPHDLITRLIHGAASGLRTCACVLAAPHASQRAGNAGSIAFSLLAGVGMAVFVILEIMA